jgi:hypothetical protein
MIVLNGGRLFHLSLDLRDRWAWLSILPDRANTARENRNVPLGRRAWEFLKWGRKWTILSWTSSSSEPTR